MSTQKLARIETTILAEDAELLVRVAKNRNMPVSELIRQALYANISQLRRANEERNERAIRETEERRKMREWNAGSGGDNH